MVADALRSTLDRLQLDPEVQEDRHYLITMLRRLGYTEIEIREALGELVEETPEPEPQPEPEPEPAPEPVIETTVVELEYKEESDLGEVEDFEPVYASREGGFIVQETDEAFEPVEERKVRFEEVEDKVQFESIEDEEEEDWEEASEEDWEPVEQGKRVRLKVVAADSPEAAAEEARRQGYNVVHTVPVNVHTDRQQAEDFSGDWGMEETWEESESTQSWESSESEWQQPDEAEVAPVETQEAPSEWEAVEEEPAWDEAPTPAETATEADSSWETVEEHAWEEPAQEEATWETETSWSEPESGSDALVIDDYVLHQKVAETDKGPETMYFFVKGSSDQGTPCALPDGYKVSTFPGSGLPFIEKEA